MKRTQIVIAAIVVLLVVACPWGSIASGQGLDAKVNALEKQLAAQSERLGQLEAKEPIGAPGGIKAYWKDGMWLETADGAIKVNIGGRLHYDLGWISCDDQAEDIVGRITDTAEARRARLHARGQLYDNIDFKLEFDFAGNDAVDNDIRDAWIRIKDLPLVDNLMIGHMKEPFGLEELTSANYITFMERASVTEAFVPDRNAGIMVHSTTPDKRTTWAVGAFRPTAGNGFALAERGYQGTARVTHLPWYEDGGERLLHVGVAYSYRSMTEAKSARYMSRPEHHNIQSFVDTAYDADHANLFGLESALVLGPLSLQAELMAALTDAGSAAAEQACMKGMYFQTSYFLTGEHRPYQTSSGTFGRIRPKANFGADGLGAFEVAGRVSCLDLNDGVARGGRMINGTLGMNWYLNPNVRLMFNYVHSCLDRNADDGEADLFLARAQFDF